MVKAQSLLYAIYICLIVSLLCGALLYMATLYGQLNLYYTSHEDLYIHNQSLVNYALANPRENEIPQENSIEGVYETRQYGLFTLLTAKSVLHNDTIASVHLAGRYTTNKTCLYITDFSKPLSYSGTVILEGQKKLPSKDIRQMYINNSANNLTNKGTTELSDRKLPGVNPALIAYFNYTPAQAVPLQALEKENDSIYYNSFLNQTREIELAPGALGNVIIKGNFILHSSDSVYIQKSAILEDVILSAPSIAFEDGFKGSVQAFATKTLTVGNNVDLLYPSALCIYNNSLEKSHILIGNEVKLFGTLLQFGFAEMSIESNFTETGINGCITGDVYCAGMLTLRSNVFGSVYTNRIVYKTPSSTYENCIADIEINIDKRPDYFISAPLFDENTQHYGLIKKVL